MPQSINSVFIVNDKSTFQECQRNVCYGFLKFVWYKHWCTISCYSTCIFSPQIAINEHTNHILLNVCWLFIITFHDCSVFLNVMKKATLVTFLWLFWFSVYLIIWMCILSVDMHTFWQAFLIIRYLLHDLTNSTGTV